MSKPLSEQVKWLENEHDYQQDTIKALRTENAALWSKNDRLIAEKTELRAQRDQTQEVADQAMAMQNKLTLENISLRAGQGRWPEHDDFPAGEQVPRVIEADEIRPEQIIAYWQEGVRPNPFGEVAHVRTVEMEDDGSYCVADPEGRFNFLGGDVDFTIVLLEDAPTSDDDDDPVPRLTVHALNTAPVGSWLNRAGRSLPRLIKQPDGLWAVSITHVGLSSEFALSEWPDATLTHPERGDHE